MKRPRNTLKTYFQKGKKPTEEQFSDTLDSFVHKDDSLPIDNVEGLRGALDSKLDQGAESELIKVFDQKLEEAKNTINKAYLGIAVPASTVPPIGSFWFRVESGNIATFQNLKDSSGNPINTIAEDFEKDGAFYDVTIEVKDGIAKKELSQKASSTTPKWSNKPFNKDAQVIYAGCIWKSNAPTSGTDVPGVSDRWDLSLQGLDSIDDPDLFQITDASGNIIATWDKRGNLFTNYRKESIPLDSIEGIQALIYASDVVHNNLPIINSPDLLEFHDADGNILGYFDREGVFHTRKIVAKKIIELKKDKSNVTDKRNIILPKMEFFEMHMKGALPTDGSPDRIPTQVEISIVYENRVLVTLNAKISIQGQNTIGFPKKGYSIDFYNSEWKSVTLKIGDWISTDGLHYKAYYTDSTHTKDVGSGRLWMEMARQRKTPFMLQSASGIPTTFNAKSFSTDAAKFHTDGIPSALYISGNFIGLYTLRLKKSVANYAIDNANENHIFLDSQLYEVAIGGKNYPDIASILIDYEAKSPKKLTPAAIANIERLFKWARSVNQNQASYPNTYAQYVDKESWIDSVILREVIGHWDYGWNNMALATIDGKIWHNMLIDMDLVIGSEARGDLIATRKTSIDTSINDVWVWPLVHLLPDVKARYKFLRDNGTLSMKNFQKIYGGISKNIPVEIYEADAKKWGTPWAKGYTSMSHIYGYLQSSLNYLDTAWQYQP